MTVLTLTQQQHQHQQLPHWQQLHVEWLAINTTPAKCQLQRLALVSTLLAPPPLSSTIDSSSTQTQPGTLAHRIPGGCTALGCTAQHHVHCHTVALPHHHITTLTLALSVTLQSHGSHTTVTLPFTLPFTLQSR
jgi:hypothetical protein